MTSTNLIEIKGLHSLRNNSYIDNPKVTPNDDNDISSSKLENKSERERCISGGYSSNVMPYGLASAPTATRH